MTGISYRTDPKNVFIEVAGGTSLRNRVGGDVLEEGAAARRGNWQKSTSANSHSICGGSHPKAWDNFCQFLLEL